MPSSLSLLLVILPIFAVIGAGLMVRHLKILTEEADRSLFKLSVNLLTPCLVFDSILGNQALKDPTNPVVAPLLGFISVALGLFLSLALASWAGLKRKSEQRSFALAVGIYNWGYLALPIIQTLFDKETVGVLFVFNLGVETAMWTLGIMILTGGGWAQGWRRILNPPVLSILLALILNSFGARDWLPSPLLATIHLLAPCAIPLGLLLVGASFYDQLGEVSWSRSWRVGLLACALRLALLPALFLLMLAWIPLPSEIQKILVVQAAMPSAVFPIVLTRHYGGDAGTAFRAILATALVSLLTIPFWISLGLKMIENSASQHPRAAA
ncbi:MAG: AEC family transporter [Blastochloris sp.]|nr:AEC family transporter [Blastochloris sp.]